MSQQQPARPPMHPIYPIPIISPQPLLPSNKLPGCQDELQIYKREYSRLIKENNLLLAHLAKITEEKEALEKKYNSLHVDPSSNDEKKKRFRRTAGQIVRDYACLLDRCGKSYGTEASLAQHVKLKHPEVYGSKDYQSYMSELRRKVGNKLVQPTQGSVADNSSPKA